MYPFQQSYEQFYAGQQIPQLMYQDQGFRHTYLPSVPSGLIAHHCNIINNKANFISSVELTNILDKLFNEFENFRDEKQQLTNLEDVITVLTRVRRLTLAAVAQHQFFSLIRMPLIQILQQWNNASNLTEDEVLIFRKINRLLKSLLSDVVNTSHYPSWLTDSSLLDTIAVCFINISTSDKFYNNKNAREVRNFTRLLDIYDGYQKLLNEEKTTNQDQLVQLLDPVIHCLTSNHYFESFDNIQSNAKSASKKEKFFLIRCPTFFTAYNGSRLEQTANNLLSIMLPKYILLFDRTIPSVQKWKRPMLRAVNQLLKIVNHGSGNTKLISTHLPLIDHILKIIDVKKFHDNLRKKLSNPETNLINTAVSLLVNLIDEPIILNHIKQKNVASSFLRLTSAPYEPLVLNIYTLLAYTTSEEDIKSMQNPGALLSTVVKALKTSVDKKSNNQDRTVQLLETLKGLVQHDQLKEEILKQNILSFLLDCTNKLVHTELIVLLETLWTLSFSQDIAKVLRANPQLLEKVQTASKDTTNEGLKKAADGLVWKLVREPAFLDKVAKQEKEEDLHTGEGVPVTIEQIIIQPDGTKKLVTTTKRRSIAAVERTFQYDIMISYCHADQELIKKIHHFLLNQGFKIWIDLDNMFGPAMNAMADAVENSEFVLLCMSDSYKKSTYCQAEAEYAFNCKRRLVPLIVRPGYKADGWLGFMIGTRIYIDFGHFDFDTACEKLMDEMSRQRKRPMPAKPAPTKQPEHAATPVPTLKVPGQTDSQVSDRKTGKISGEKPTVSFQKVPDLYTQRKPSSDFNKKYIGRWTESDVLDFLFSHHLNELMPLCENMDGPALIQLYKMCMSRHNRIYTVLNDQLKMTHKIFLPIGTYARFLSVMERVVTLPSQPQPQRMLLPPIPPQRMLLPPIQPQRKLLPPIPPPQPQSQFMSMRRPPPPSVPFQPVVNEPLAQNSDSSYDIIITSDAPPLQVLGMVQHVGSRWKLKNAA